MGRQWHGGWCIGVGMPTALNTAISVRKGNKQALVNASHVRYHRLKIGELPKEMMSIRARVRAYRQDLERVCIEQHGDINITQAHSIDLACQGEMLTCLGQWLLRHKLSTLTSLDILACGQSMLRGKTVRNHAVKELQLDQDRAFDPAVLYSIDYSPAPPEAPQEPQEADPQDQAQQVEVEGDRTLDTEVVE